MLLDSSKISNLNGKIVLIENADPGYVIFSYNIKGLVTKYGGVASHMAIRCAEFDIPAAIGCGVLKFDKLKNSKRILLDCKNYNIKEHLMKNILVTQRIFKDKHDPVSDRLENNYINFLSRFDINPILLPNSGVNTISYLIANKCKGIILTGEDINLVYIARTNLY